MSAPPADELPVVPGAAFVASVRGYVYYWVGSKGWREIPPLERVWFATEEEAKRAGYRPSAAAWEPLEDFEILGELGRGGTSVVYHALDRVLGREVAIKVIYAYLENEPETEARFAQEARLLAALRHPNIVSAFAVKRVHGGGFALVMEYVRGRTLRAVIDQEGPLDPARVEQILKDVASALAAAHKHGIVHRDVKPDNIFLEEETGRALLADFGIAVNLENPSGLTMSGVAVGTPNYMAPEQVDGAAVDGRSDLYSLALIGWEMLSGRKPWAGESLYSVIYKQKHEELPPIRKVRPDVPVRLAFAIEGALAKDASARWESADEFLRHLTDRSLAGRWRQLSRAVLLKRRAQARLTAVSKRVEAAALETAKTVFFRRPEYEDYEEPAPRPVGSPRLREALATACLGVASVLAVTAVVAGGDTPLSSAPAGSGAPAAHPGAGMELPAQPRVPAPDLGSSTFAGAPEESLPALAAALPTNGAALQQEDPPAPEPIAASDDPAPTPGVVEQPVPPPAPEPGIAAEFPLEEAEEEADADAAASGAPGPALPVGRSASRIATGGMHTCEIDATQSVVCWGGNDRGQLGTSGTRQAGAPVRVEAATGVRAIEAGGFHTCALRSLGTVLCWGDNSDGQLGGSMGDGGVVRLSGSRFAALSLGTAHSCGLASDGSVHCWGSNAQGQLGDGTFTSRGEPARVTDLSDVARVSSGWYHTCAVTRAGRALCWGDNSSGQLGDGTTDDRAQPVPVRGGLLFRSVVAGSAHTCGLTLAGEVYCWGQNGAGQLGDGSTTDRREPVPVSLPVRIAEITAGGRHSCGLASDGTAWCWGQNNYGQLGTGNTTALATPARVATDVRFVTIRSSGSHTCGVAADGSSWCWGYNVEGQVGDGTQTHRYVPHRVAP